MGPSAENRTQICQFLIDFQNLLFAGSQVEASITCQIFVLLDLLVFVRGFLDLDHLVMASVYKNQV